MAKKRTKADKVRAAARSHEVHHAVSLPPTAATAPLKLSLPDFVTSAKVVQKTSATQTKSAWRFDPSLIYQDLLKTGLASGLIVGILVLIYWLSF